MCARDVNFLLWRDVTCSFQAMYGFALSDPKADHVARKKLRRGHERLADTRLPEPYLLKLEHIAAQVS